MTAALTGTALPEVIALDVHAHLVPVAPARLATLDGVVWNEVRRVLEIDGHAVGVPQLYEPAALIDWMDLHHIQQAWVSIPPPLYRQQLDAAASADWAAYLNEGLVAMCAQTDRLTALPHLPIEHPQLAAKIASEQIAAGARGFAIAAGGRGTPVYSDAQLDPLWSVLDQAACFVFVHPGACCDGRLKAFYLENLVGNPYETAVAAAHLVFGGVCERFPRVRFCLAHGGGATAMLAGRLQHGFATGRPGIDTGRAAPRVLLRHFWADCVVHDTTTLAFAAATFGDDRIVFGSDWPFPMGVLEPGAYLGTVAAPLRRRLQQENPQALLAHARERSGNPSIA